MRIALFTLDSALSRAAIAHFIGEHAASIVLLGLSIPDRPKLGGPLRQVWRHLRRSGPRLLPYLVVNYALPRLTGGRLARLAAERGIPVHRVLDVNGPVTAAALAAARPDLLVSFHFDQIFSGETLAASPRGGVNVHPGLLPAHRGPVPTIWALAEDAPRFGVTVHRLVPRIDAGAILAQVALDLPPDTTASAAARALHKASLPLIASALQTIEAGGSEPEPPTPLPYCPFPPAAMLRTLARKRRWLVNRDDVIAAFRRSVT